MRDMCIHVLWIFCSHNDLLVWVLFTLILLTNKLLSLHLLSPSFLYLKNVIIFMLSLHIKLGFLILIFKAQFVYLKPIKISFYHQYYYTCITFEVYTRAFKAHLESTA